MRFLHYVLSELWGRGSKKRSHDMEHGSLSRAGKGQIPLRKARCLEESEIPKVAKEPNDLPRKAAIV